MHTSYDGMSAGKESVGHEREVVALVARGPSNHEVGDQVVISPATATTHVSRAMTTLAARPRVVCRWPACTRG